MSYDPNRESKRKKQLILESIVKLIVILFVALIIAAELGYYDGDSAKMMENITNDLTTPRPGATLPIPALFSIFPINFSYALRYVAIGLLAWFVWFVSDWIKYTMQKNMRPGEEHGSAAFNLNYAKMEHDYIMSPKILKEGKQEEVFAEIIREGRRGYVKNK